MNYDRRLPKLSRNISPKDDSEKEGKGEREEEGKEGRREGRKEGGKAGRREGRKEGRKAGRQEGRKDRDCNEETWISLLEKSQYGSYKALHKSVSFLEQSQAM